jgi:anthranilate synthase component 1
MIIPTYEEIMKLREHGNVIPVFKAVMADLLTPVSAFMKIAGHQDYAFLLESIEGGEKIARYSFIGCDPFLIVRSKKDSVELDYKFRKEVVPGNVVEILRNLLGKYKAAPVSGLPPFSGGGVGYFAYDLVKQFEALPDAAVDTLGLDDTVIMFYATLLAFDHLKHQILIISNIVLEEGENERTLAAKYGFALREIGHLESRLSEPLNSAARGQRGKSQSTPALAVTSNLTQEQYYQIVRKAQEYIKAGDTYQVVLSQRFEVEVTSNPFDIYRALRVINPSPYMFFLKMRDLAVTGASPEMLVKALGNNLEYRPIAGTRPRGATEVEDKAFAEDLKTDEKERAEHLMLVDLGRNDLGRVCEYGSVRARELMFIEKYSHVMHLVSALEGKLRQEHDRFDAFIACFPAGTISGAPKVRAMQIIDELEPTRRGVYGGAIAYLDFSGNLDSCIALRTLLVKDGKAYVQAGGGIVADSTPEGEYQESVNKAMALVHAIELAERNFDP